MKEKSGEKMGTIQFALELGIGSCIALFFIGLGAFIFIYVGNLLFPAPKE